MVAYGIPWETLPRSSEVHNFHGHPEICFLRTVVLDIHLFLFYILLMAQYRYFRLVGAICLVLNGVTLIAICTGWKIWGIIFERRRPLLGCSGTATGLSILQLLAACVYHPEQTSAIFWILARLCSVLEALVLSAVLALLYVSTSATDCFHGGGRVNFCRVTVNTKQFLSCLMLADPLPVYHHEYNGNGTYIIVLYGDRSTSRKE